MRGSPDPREAGAVGEAGISEREITFWLAAWGSFVPAFEERPGTRGCCHSQALYPNAIVPCNSSHVSFLMLEVADDDRMMFLTSENDRR
jgi:hypothetical protein